MIDAEDMRKMQIGFLLIVKIELVLAPIHLFDCTGFGEIPSAEIKASCPAM